MFHDTLPGSSIRLAVEDYDASFKRILETGHELFKSALVALEGSDDSHETVVLNTLHGVSRREVVPISSGEMKVAEVSNTQLCGTINEFKPENGVTGKRLENIGTLDKVTLYSREM